MGRAPKDRRPRVLDFSGWIDGVRLSRDLGWPCDAHRVAIPIRPAGRLNIFEVTVLRLLDTARLDEHALARTTCLDVSLVKLVCSRLRDLGMLEEQNEISALGRTLLSKVEDEELEYEVRTIFRERVGNTLLPIVYSGGLRYEELSKWSDRHAEIAKTTRKGARAVHLRLLRVTDGPNPVPPTMADVLWATNRHKELSRQYSVLRSGVAPCPHVVHAHQINVDPNPDPVFLRCRVVVPATSDDYRIGDPFGYGYSDTLRRAYEGVRAVDAGEREFIHRLREDSLTVRPHRPSAKAEDRAAERAVMTRLSDSVSQHGHLFRRLRQAERELRRSRKPPRNVDEEAHFAYHGQQAAQSLAEALEAALGKVMVKSRPAACETLLSGHGQTHEDNRLLLEKLAKRLGLGTDGIGGLLRVPPGRIRGLRDGVVDLQALLAVAIGAAAEEQEHPLRPLASAFPDWLLFIRELKAMRDAGAHGQSTAAGSKRLETLREGTYRSIELLVPGLRRGAVELHEEGEEHSDYGAHDARRKAITRLEDRFGVQWYAGVNTDSAELLIQIELATARLNANTEEPVNVGRIINDLASLLQSVVHAQQAQAERGRSEPSRPREMAGSRAVESGLLASGEELPEAIATVNPRRLSEALRGLSPTLGASVVAFIILSPLERLQRMAVASPGFLQLVARVLDARGHGNGPVLMSCDEFLTLKDEIYTACSCLTGA